MINPEPQSAHQYKMRSCITCTHFLNRSCHAYAEHQQSIMWSDKGLYGCLLYDGVHLNEKPKKEIKRVTKKR